MLTCKSPRKVRRAAYHPASPSFPTYSNKFSHKDFTLPELFACLAIKVLLRRGYRGAEELLRDCDHWLKDIGMRRAPDHNTLRRSAAFLLKARRVGKLLDKVAQWAALGRIPGLSGKPLAVDGTMYESHHVSRRYERRRHETRRRMRAKEVARKGRATTRSQTVRRLPKLTLGVASRCHLVLSARASTAAAGPTSRTWSRWCWTPGGGCPTGGSRSPPTPGTTRRPTTRSSAATWACGR